MDPLIEAYLGVYNEAFNEKGEFVREGPAPAPSHPKPENSSNSKKSKKPQMKKEELEYILDILVSEGFAVDYEGAVCILEAMSDEWVNYILQEAPYDIVHHGSTIDGTRVGPREPSVVKTYKNKKRAKNKAEEMNQDYGAHAYSVRYRPEQ
jgi:hypothetical protein